MIKRPECGSLGWGEARWEAGLGEPRRALGAPIDLGTYVERFNARTNVLDCVALTDRRHRLPARRHRTPGSGSQKHATTNPAAVIFPGPRTADGSPMLNRRGLTCVTS
jgi:hypothetical protein